MREFGVQDGGGRAITRRVSGRRGRQALVAILAGSLVFPFASTVFATGEAPADESEQVTEQDVTTEEASAEEADAPSVTDTDSEQGHDHGDFFGYGGRATGPMPLPTLPDDPAYPVPAPPLNELLPEELDALPPLGDNILCNPVDFPGVEAFGNLIGEHYNRPYYSTTRSCAGVRSLHHEGRALDWPLNAYDPQDRRIGDAVVTWLTDNDGEMAARMGVRSIIWNHRTWRIDDTAGWRGYVGQSPHTDHVHFSFTWDGAMMRTSWWTGVAVTEPDLGPCEVVRGAYAALPQGPRLEACTAVGALSQPQTGYAEVRPGRGGPGVELLQPILGVPETGVLDADTQDALLQWQEEQGIPQTGILDQFTYAAALGLELPEIPAEALAVPLAEHQSTEFTPYKRVQLTEGDRGEAVAVLQAALDVDPDGSFGPVTAEALRAYTEAHPLLRESVTTSPLVWHLLEHETYPTLAYREHELALGDEGFVVAVLQAQLGVDTDGRFGPITEAALQQVQEDAGLEPTGVADGPTWAVADQGQLAGLLGAGITIDEMGRRWFGGAILLTVQDLPTASE